MKHSSIIHVRTAVENDASEIQERMRRNRKDMAIIEKVMDSSTEFSNIWIARSRTRSIDQLCSPDIMGFTGDV
jgi:hypothetical protein